MHELETERLWLRMWREGDWEPLHETYADPEVVRWLGRSPGPKEFTAYAVGRMSMHWEAHGFGMWAVIDKASNEMVGRVGLMFHPGWPVDEHKTEIGWTLRRSSWGRGYATEAGLAARDWAFGNLANRAADKHDGPRQPPFAGGHEAAWTHVERRGLI